MYNFCDDYYYIYIYFVLFVNIKIYLETNTVKYVLAKKIRLCKNLKIDKMNTNEKEDKEDKRISLRS